MPIQLNPSLDPDRLAAAYEPTQRMQIRNFLTEQSARTAYEDLHKVPWGLVYNDGDRPMQMSPEQVAQLSDSEAATIMSGIRARAREGYQFLYAFFPLLTAYTSPNSPRFEVFDFFEFMNSSATLNFLRKVTGLSSIRWADGQGTWYKPGHFLKAHTDEEASTGRLAAYVMNLTPVWERDCGGFLQFFDEHDNVEVAFKPTFNTLNIFTVPQLHSVSMVANYVTAERISITGWLRGDEPPEELKARL